MQLSLHSMTIKVMQKYEAFYFSEILSLKGQKVDFLEKCLLCPHKTADLVLCQQISANWSASLSFGPAGREA